MAQIPLWKRNVKQRYFSEKKKRHKNNGKTVVKLVVRAAICRNWKRCYFVVNNRCNTVIYCSDCKTVILVVLSWYFIVKKQRYNSCFTTFSVPGSDSPYCYARILNRGNSWYFKHDPNTVNFQYRGLLCKRWMPDRCRLHDVSLNYNSTVIVSADAFEEASFHGFIRAF